NLLVATGTLATGETMDHAVGMWFIALGAITASGVIAALAERSMAVTAVLGTLAAGCVLIAIAFLSSSMGTQHTAGWVVLISAGLAWYTASGMMINGAAGRTILPLFKLGAEPTRPVELAFGEPGVKQGQ